MTTQKSIELENFSVQVRNFFSKMGNIKGNISRGSTYELNNEELEQFREFIEKVVGEEGSIEEAFNKLMEGLSIDEKYAPFKKYHSTLKEMFAKNAYQLLKIDIDSKKSDLQDYADNYKNALKEKEKVVKQTPSNTNYIK